MSTNPSGQLGSQKPGYTSPARSVETLKGKAVSLAASDYFTCALTSDGTVWCWGSGSGGRLGTGRKEQDMSAQPVRAKLPCSR